MIDFSLIKTSQTAAIIWSRSCQTSLRTLLGWKLRLYRDCFNMKISLI